MRLFFSKNAIGRLLLHLGCLCRGGKFRAALGLIATLHLAGCEKSSSPATSGGMVTQGSPPPPAQTYEGVDLAQLTRDLKRWIITTKERPASFEEYVTKAKATVPPAPPGKKFALSKEMRVILVDR